MKTSELTGAALDWAVAKCEGDKRINTPAVDLIPNYSTNWIFGGPIIERERIQLSDDAGVQWIAHSRERGEAIGPTPLIAAMRCYVASKLGDTVDVPDELTGELK